MTTVASREKHPAVGRVGQVGRQRAGLAGSEEPEGAAGIVGSARTETAGIEGIGYAAL